MTTPPESTGGAAGAPSVGADRTGLVRQAGRPPGAVARGGLRARLRPFPFHPILLAAYPVLFLFAQNLSEVALGETYQPILRAATVAIVITLMAGAVLRDLRRGALIASTCVVIWFAYGYIRDLAQPLGLSRDVLLGACLVVLVGVSLLAWRLRPGRIATLTTAVNVVAVLLVALTMLDIVPHQLSRGTIAATPTTTERPTPAAGARDVWFLVFDRYGDEQAMLDSAGVDNDLPEWLEGQGFAVARQGRANYGRTVMSLAATLNMTYLDDLAAQMGADSDDSTRSTTCSRTMPSTGSSRAPGATGTSTSAAGSRPPRPTASPTRTPCSAARATSALLDDTTLGPTIELMGVKAPPPTTCCIGQPRCSTGTSSTG
ncbi:MAG: hypothetical protein U0667_06690 [Chloroflexota bacterium]